MEHAEPPSPPPSRLFYRGAANEPTERTLRAAV
jgi:hypothetical protein